MRLGFIKNRIKHQLVKKFGKIAYLQQLWNKEVQDM